jgi:hypothetical protein
MWDWSWSCFDGPARPQAQLTASGDTILHSWEVLSQILQSDDAKGIVCDIGMYVRTTPVSARHG